MTIPTLPNPERPVVGSTADIASKKDSDPGYKFFWPLGTKMCFSADFHGKARGSEAPLIALKGERAIVIGFSKTLDYRVITARDQIVDVKDSEVEFDGRFWICGKLIGDWKPEGSAWAFQGIFAQEEDAEEACRDENYFFFPATLGHDLPDEDTEIQDARWPRRGNKKT